MEAAHLSVRPVQGDVSHPKPDLSTVDRALRSVYAPPKDGIETNLLVLFHGLGE
jgi:hypothetical protein